MPQSNWNCSYWFIVKIILQCFSKHNPLFFWIKISWFFFLMQVSRTYPQIWGFPGSPTEDSACKTGDPGSIPGSERFPWIRKWLPTPVFLPGEFHGQRSLAGYSPWCHKELGHDWATNTHPSHHTLSDLLNQNPYRWTLGICILKVPQVIHVKSGGKEL